VTENAELEKQIVAINETQQEFVAEVCIYDVRCRIFMSCSEFNSLHRTFVWSWSTGTVGSVSEECPVCEQITLLQSSEVTFRDL